MSSRLPPRIVQQLPAPPPIFGRIRHRNDISRLEIKLFVNRRGIVVQRFHYQPTSAISPAMTQKHAP